MSKSIKAFLNDPYAYSENNDVKILVKLATFSDDAYYNGSEPVMSDQQYDLLRDLIRKADPSNPYLLKTGASIEKVDKVKISLPYVLGSMFKPSSSDMEKFITKFKAKYPGPYMISEKLDGVSALLQINEKKGHKLMTKGDSEVGTDISNLIPGLIEAKTDIPMDIRGEIIMGKDVFQENHSAKKNARNTVSGLVNSKTVDNAILEDCEFVAYEIIKPWMPFSSQMEIAKKVNKFTVQHELVNDFTIETLQKLYAKYVARSFYDCDGIIVAHNNPSKRENVKYPKYAFAFKDMTDMESAVVTIKSINWQISKDGYIKPVVMFDPVLLAGVSIQKVTAHNAKYIYDNNLGPGAKITIIRSGFVIPYIKNIIKGAKEPQMPDIDYEWNLSEVDIVTSEYSSEQKLKELVKFFVVIGVENLAESNTRKLIDANIDTIPKVVRITKKQLSNVAGFKAKMVEKIYNSIHEKVSNMTLPMFMVASNIFGHGFGKRLMALVFKTYPDIFFKYIEMSENDFYDCLMLIDGFAEERSSQFQMSMEILLELIDQMPQNIQNQLVFTDNKVKVAESDKRFVGKSFVFSGQRMLPWEQIITDNGGTVGSSVSKNTYMVVTTQDVIEQETNSKIVKALKLGVRLLNHEDFAKEFIS